MTMTMLTSVFSKSDILIIAGFSMYQTPLPELGMFRERPGDARPRAPPYVGVRARAHQAGQRQVCQSP